MSKENIAAEQANHSLQSPSETSAAVQADGLPEATTGKDSQLATVPKLGSLATFPNPIEPLDEI